MVQLRSDQPIEDFKHDELGRREFVDRLTRPLLDWPPTESLVIGLYAPWGSGKSSVLHLLRARLDEKDAKSRAIVVRFNPWLYSDAETLLVSFFETLLAATKSTALLTGARKKSLGTAIKAIGKFVVPVASVAASPATGGVDIVGPAAQGVLHALDAFLAGGETSFEEQKEKAASILRSIGSRKNPARLVVLIDDLDRAEVAEVRAMLKLVRLIADLPNVTYVIAMDFERVAELLDEGEGRRTGEAYLEKIVQIPIQLPPIAPSKIETLLIDDFERVLAERGGAGESADVRLQLSRRNIDLTDLIGWRVRTLRDRARLTNTYLFLLLSGSDLLEVDPVDAMLVAFLQAFYPALVERLRRNKEFLTVQSSMQVLMRQMHLKDEQKKLARRRSFLFVLTGKSVQEDDQPEGSDEEIEVDPGAVVPEQERAKLRTILLRLFPYAENGEDVRPDDARRWRRSNRIAAPERFDRYFAYSDPEETASDKEVDKFVETRVLTAPPTAFSRARRADPTGLVTVLADASRARSVDFLNKVLDRAEELPVEGMAPLAFSIAALGASGKVDSGEAAAAIERLTTFVRGQRSWATGSLRDEVNAKVQDVPVGLQDDLHEAFAALIRDIEDPFDAVAGAADYSARWDRFERRDDPEQSEMSRGVRAVHVAGLDRISEATAAGRDVFVQSVGRPGEAIWRWRDLLREQGSGFDVIRRYLGDILKQTPERLPAALGLLAGWSDDVPSLRFRSYSEICRSAKEVLGWVALLRAVVTYRRLESPPADPIHDHLVDQFVRLVANSSRHGKPEREPEEGADEDDEDAEDEDLKR